MMKRSCMLTLIDLPGNAIDEILIRLPIRDTVRTSVLSRAWRRRWRSIPYLTVSGLPDAAITQLLLLHSDGPLLRFRVRLNRTSPFHCWFSALSPHCTHLALTSNDMDLLLSINSISRYFPNLSHLHLNLRSLPFSPTNFSGFPHLRVLHLRVVECGHLSMLIAACPLLVELTLRFLHLDGQSLDIAAPNLRRLELIRLKSDSFSMATSAPLLGTAIIRDSFYSGHANYARISSNVMGVLGRMPFIRKLELGFSLLIIWAEDLIRSGGQIPKRIPFSFDHLRFMSLEIIMFDCKHVSLALCLLRSTPNLEELEIKGYRYVVPNLALKQDFWEAQEHIDIFDRLETVKMTRMAGTRAELNFIQFVLATALALKTMMISFQSDVNSKESESVKTKLLEYPRASNQARIQLTDEKERQESEEWR